MASAVAVNAFVVEPSSKSVSAGIGSAMPASLNPWLLIQQTPSFCTTPIAGPGSSPAPFPSGLTTWDASGQWRDEHNVIEHERTHIVQIVHPVANGEDEGRIEAIVAAYKKKFAQKAVFRVRSDVFVHR